MATDASCWCTSDNLLYSYWLRIIDVSREQFTSALSDWLRPLVPHVEVIVDGDNLFLSNWLRLAEVMIGQCTTGFLIDCDH